MSKSLTKWQPAATCPPTRPGIYNVSCLNTGQSGNWYAHFDGSRWSDWERIDRAGSWQKLVKLVLKTSGAWGPGRSTWRGLASDPKAKP